MTSTEKMYYWLFYFGFFVDHMFAHNRVVFFDFNFVWHGTFIFIRCVIVTSAGSWYEFDFVTHVLIPEVYLDFDATSTKIGQNLIDPFFIDDTQTLATDA